MSSHSTYLTAEEAAAMLRDVEPIGSSLTDGRRKGALPSASFLLGFEEIPPEVVDSFPPLAPFTAGFGPPTSRATTLRASHHRMAKLLAIGVPTIQVSRVCGVTPGRITGLLSEPAFQELVAHYTSEEDDSWAEFVALATDLSLDALSALREMLDEHPERFTPQLLMDLVKVSADRSGNAPVAKSVNVNVNQDMGSRMLAAEQRERAALARSRPSDGE